MGHRLVIVAVYEYNVRDEYSCRTPRGADMCFYGYKRNMIKRRHITMDAIYDCHLHTEFSADSETPVRDQLEKPSPLE